MRGEVLTPEQDCAVGYRAHAKEGIVVVKSADFFRIRNKVVNRLRDLANERERERRKGWEELNQF